MQEEIEYEEPQESYEEEDGRSNVADLITVDESSNADAFSLAYIQVSLSRFVIRGHSNNTWHCHQITQWGREGLTKVSRDIFWTVFGKKYYTFLH